MFPVKLRRAVVIAIGALTIVASQSAPASAAAPLPLLVNFQSADAPTPAGYIADTGEAFTAARGFGWTNLAGSPLSLVGNGRDRNAAADQRLDTLMQPQLKAGSPGVSTEGAWRAEIPNGNYEVTVAAGDASYFDSRHVVRIEGVPAIDFTPTAANPFVTQTVARSLTDGYLTVDSVGGTNTKINYIEIRPVDVAQPTITSVDPALGATNVSRSKAVTIQLSEAVDSTTLTGLNLIGPGNAVVAGNRNTDAAGSNATFVPAVQLQANSQYIVQTTTALKTANGVSYKAFNSSFTTGATGDAVAPVSFNRGVFSALSGVTALTLSPDNSALYAAVNDGSIFKYNLDGNGNPSGSPSKIAAFEFQRLILGLEFDPTSTPANPKLWVSHGELCADDCPDFTGQISVLTGANLDQRRDVIVGLPRSVKDHMNNGIEFGPDGLLYITQGSNTGYGAPDDVWGFRSENPLNATILTANVNGDARFNGQVNVRTSTPTNYNPNAVDAPVKIYTEGIRNPFSLVWHSNGKLYAPVNESASGNAPAGPGNNPPPLNNLDAYNDYFTQVEPNKYYGHPNPSRGYFRLNGGNPTAGVDPFEVTEYPQGTQPDAKWRQPDLNLGVHRSADGSAEFKSNVFGSNLKGQILVTEYSQGDDVIAVKLDTNGKPVSKAVVATGFFNPLAIASNPVTGRTYVGEYGRDPDGVGGQIAVLSPVADTPPPTGGGEAVKKINFQPAASQVPAGYTADTGAAYSAARGFGWETAAGAPVDLTGKTRERNSQGDQRFDTLLFMQHTNNGAVIGPEGRWQLDISNGTYAVTVGLGDPSYFDNVNVIRAEGNVIANFTPTNGERNKSFTANVTITDGKLTLDQTGGQDTKINYVEVFTTGPTTPPPTGGTQVARVNFQTETAATPAGYSADFGTAYSSVRGSGWENRDALPLNLVGNGRERNVLIDKRLDTFVHMAFTGTSNGINTEGQWSINAPNGTYKVVAGVGDASYTDSIHTLRAEGIQIGSFTPSAGTTNATFTASQVVVADGKLTIDQVGGNNTKINFVDIDTAGVTPPTLPDTTPPVVTVTPSGTTNASGQYVGSATVTINASDPSGVSNVSYTLDNGPVQVYNAPFTVSTVGSHTVRATASDTKANTTPTPISSTFTVVATPSGPSNLQVTTPQDYLGLGSRLVFSTVNYSTQPTQNFTVRNTGASPLQVTNLQIGGTNPNAFKLVAGQSTNFSIAPNATATIGVQFTPTVFESNQGTLTVTTNENGSSQKVITLGGMNATNFEGDNEPSLQAVLDSLGYKNSVGVSNEFNNFISKSALPIADEITAPYFKRVDASKPVQLYPLANYSGRSQFAKGPFGFNPKASATEANNGLYLPGGTDSFGGQNQRILPSIANGGSTAWNTPLASFGYRNGNSGSDPGYSDDNLNGPSKVHNVRVYPAKDRSGVVIPYTYILAEDLGWVDVSPKNWDYQDHVFLLTNAAPEAATPPPATAPNPGSASLNFPFNQAVAGTVAGADGRGTGFTSVQANTAGNQFVPGSIALNLGTGNLELSSAAGTSSEAANTQRNALQCAFNATAGNFRVQAKLVGPFSFLNVENEQQAIFFGLDQNNYLKAEVEFAGGQKVLTVWLEQNGTGQIVRRIPLTNQTPTSVELMIDANPIAKTATVSYSINGGSVVALTTSAVSIPTSWFSTNAQAGVLVSHALGQPFTGIYSNWSVVIRP